MNNISDTDIKNRIEFINKQIEDKKKKAQLILNEINILCKELLELTKDNV